MKKLLFLPGGLLLAGCVLNNSKLIEPIDYPDETIIAVTTGRWLKDGWPYEAEFKAAATAKCPMGYTLLERSRTPLGVQQLEPTSFYWRIKCLD